MVICRGPRCQTAAGCQCTSNIPHPVKTPLCEYSDEAIAREYHWRMLKKLGDPGVRVSPAIIPLGGYHG